MQVGKIHAQNWLHSDYAQDHRHGTSQIPSVFSIQGSNDKWHPILKVAHCLQFSSHCWLQRHEGCVPLGCLHRKLTVSLGWPQQRTAHCSARGGRVLTSIRSIGWLHLLESVFVHLHEVDDLVGQALAVYVLPRCDGLTQGTKSLHRSLQAMSRFRPRAVWNPTGQITHAVSLCCADSAPAKACRCGTAVLSVVHV